MRNLKFNFKIIVHMHIYAYKYYITYIHNTIYIYECMYTHTPQKKERLGEIKIRLTFYTYSNWRKFSVANQRVNKNWRREWKKKRNDG